MTQIDEQALATRAAFPEGFRWGVATASYQIEGASAEDGRTPSIWDTFARTPGKVYRGHTGDIACDHYHRYPEDVAIMRDLGVQTYRFSTAWPRVKPDGTGPTNQRGLDFYDRLTDALLAAGIDPMVTLYHWDLPQVLEDRGGWTNRETAYHFADYAAAVHARLGDRVRTWTTLNEPWCSAFLGYSSGDHAPGRTETPASFRAAHHLLLGHGLAVQALRAGGAREVSITVNLTHATPLDPSSSHDVDAATIVDGLHNRIFLDPLLRGRYPTDMLALTARFAGLDHIRPGDDAIIAAPIDLLGVNYYVPTILAAKVGTAPSTQFPGTEGVVFVPQDRPTTAMDWPIDASGLRDLLLRLGRDYPETPLMITENGAAFYDVVDGDRVNDADRIDFLRSHLLAAHEAIAAGVNLQGYLAWSLLDNFEWAYGYDKRFGLVHVDYTTQRRIPKESAHWFKEVIAANALDT
ncbi:beta-glucosidase [Allocatelliglobosispora scoriae]|uniref:Beta-glucosidase n=1 Tax=Allocatelliglobosispora scoriae TaxID=643052 RepID=A0A841BTY8_9ACTN|nr:GH1 family beta-glucosidase [Allocatelliglobosispora scoriae]MBB5872557.1 beta-glucosidase [Allocatelliglobosispora scoriae]